MLSNEELTVKIQEVLASSEIVKCLSVNDVNHKPHPYCITTKHVTGKYASLSSDAIKALEKKNGPMCGMRVKGDNYTNGYKAGYDKCTVPFEKHTHDTVCFLQLKKNTTNELLSKELEPVNTMEECEGLDGFAFVDTDEKFRVE